MLVASPEWRDDSAETLDEAVVPTDIAECSKSFLEFVWRFWIENSVWFAVANNRRLSAEQKAYVTTATAVG